MELEPRELVERASRGEAAAVDALFERLLPGLRAYVRLHASPLVRERESSGDLVQSACLEVLSHMERYRYQGEANFKRWLYATALRKIQNRERHWRTQKREAERDSPLAASHSDAALLDCYKSFCSPSGEAAAREQLERVERAFTRLPEDHRRVIVLARIVGLSREEIAAEMDKSPGAVRTLLSRALAHLADLMHEASEGG